MSWSAMRDFIAGARSFGVWSARRRGGVASTIIVDTAPAITGTPEVGQTLTRTVGSYSGSGTVTVSNGRWQRNGVDIAPAQTGAAYVLVAADDGASVRWAEDVADNLSSRTVQSIAVSVAYAPPVVTGSISDQDMTRGSAAVTVVADVTALFTGADLAYAVSGYAGATRNGNALLIDPAIATASSTVTLTATNSGGTASIGFDLVVADLAFIGATFTGTGKIGSVHTAAATVNRAGATFSYDYERDGVSIGAADQTTYTPVAADNLTSLSVVISATLDGVTISAEPEGIPITYVAPVAAGGLSDQSYATGSGDQTVDASTDFTGSAIVYSVSGMGATIDPGTGILTIPTESDATGTITVTGTNSGGSDSAAFSVSISEIVVDSPVITGNGSGTVDIVVDDANGTFSIIISGSGTAHHNGTHGPFDPVDFDNGPINAVAPPITGTAGTGQTLTAGPGLWITPGNDASTITGQWYRGASAISGETGTTYLTVLSDEGEIVTYRETATNTAGTRFSDSNGIAIPNGGSAVWNIANNVLVTIADANSAGPPVVTANIVSNL